MVQWWLNTKWLADAHADMLARVDCALLIIGIAALSAYLVNG
jgi:hypothetical protein